MTSRRQADVVVAGVGNVMHRQYMGGLAVALVTGRVAGRNAATR